MAECGGEVWFKIDRVGEAATRAVNGVPQLPATALRNLRTAIALAPTWVQTCLFTLDGELPAEQEMEAYLALLAPLAPALAGVHLYSLARPSLQKEAPRLGRMEPARMEDMARRIRQLGLTVRVSP